MSNNMDIDLELLAKVSATKKDIQSYNKARKDRRKHLGGTGRPTHSFSFPDDLNSMMSIFLQHI
jgi:hypothetical protein